MDNDFKMKISKPEVKLFLGDQSFLSDATAASTYDLEKEYAKTRNNKSLFVIIVLVLTAFTICLVSFGIYKYVQNQNENVPVNVDAFEDLNLRQLLDTVSRTQNELNLALAEKERIEEEYSANTDSETRSRDSDVYMLEQLGLSRTEYNRRRTERYDQWRRSIAFIDANYEKDSAAIDVKIKELTDRLATLDSANLERAKEQRAELDSQRELFELEKQKLIVEYEAQIAALKEQMRAQTERSYEEQKRAIDTISARYKAEIALLDPIISDEEAENVLIEAAALGKPNKADFEKLLAMSNLSEKDAYLIASLERKFRGYNHLSSFVNAIPQQNTIPRYAKAMRILSDSIAADISDLALSVLSTRSSAQSEIVRLQTLVASFSYYIDNLLSQTGDCGYVLDARNPTEVVVYVSPLYAENAHNATAYVFRKADEFIGEVTLKKTGAKIVAVPKEAESGELMMSGDRILIELTN